MGNLFENTCELIYSMASKRIDEKYRVWEKNELSLNKNAAYVDFYPNNRNLISCILRNDRTCDNQYLITPKILPVLMEKLDFNDENELFWGNDISSYLEDLFIALILDMKDEPEYVKHWNDFQLNDDAQIKIFFRKYFQKNSTYLEKLEDDFIDFTYNYYSGFEIIENNGVVTFSRPDKFVNTKNKTEYLDFKYLPQKIEILTKKIVLPLLDDIFLDTLFNANIE